MKTAGFSIVALVLLTGCATASNGLSVSKGVQPGEVRVTYETRDLQASPFSMKQANNIATRRCEALGYSYTEKNVSVTQQCAESADAGTCPLWRVENAFQCAGNSIAFPVMAQMGPVVYSQAGARP